MFGDFLFILLNNFLITFIKSLEKKRFLLKPELLQKMFSKIAEYFSMVVRKSFEIIFVWMLYDKTDRVVYFQGEKNSSVHEKQ